MQKVAKFRVGDKVDYYRRGICYSGVVKQDLGILKGAGRRYRITPPEDGKHDLEWFVFDVAERHLTCDCRYENSVQCVAHKMGFKFYEAMGYGYDCNCKCHPHSDEITVANFQRFMRECNEAGIYPNIVE